MSESIAYKLKEYITGAFLPLVLAGYNSSIRCNRNVALVEFDGHRYFAASDGFVALFYQTDADLPLGDYKGLPYLVRQENDLLARNLRKAVLENLVLQPQYKLDMHEGVWETNASLAGTDVYLASVVDGTFSIHMKRPHTHVISRERLDFVAEAMGGFEVVRCSEPHHQIAFFAHNGFAVVMPMFQGKAEMKMSRRV